MRHLPHDQHKVIYRVSTIDIVGLFLVITLLSGTRRDGAKYLYLWLHDDLVNYNIVIVGTNLNNQKVISIQNKISRQS